MRTSSVLCGGMLFSWFGVAVRSVRVRQIRQFKRFSRFGRGGGTAAAAAGAKGRAKKNRRVRRRFSGISVALGAPSTLSIRQRSEMPEKIKVKLGGHDGDGCVKKVDLRFIPAQSAAGNPVTQKMRTIRAFFRKCADCLRVDAVMPYRRPSSCRSGASAGRRRPARSDPPCRTRRHPYRATCRCRSC